MLWANTQTGKATASPGASGTCPSCGASLVPKCGSIVSWHWAHKSCDCDKWSEPESEWHINWKMQFPPDWHELVKGPHRADIGTERGFIEIQRSSISAGEIREREEFYKRMIWVVWAGDWCLEEYLFWHYRKFSPFTKRHIYGTPEPWERHAWEQARLMQLKKPHYQWSPPRKTWFAAQKPIFLDFGGPFLDKVIKMYTNGPFYLTCERFSKEWLIQSWFEKLKPP